MGSSTESVTVQASAAQLDYESHSVEGTITREQIQANAGRMLAITELLSELEGKARQALNLAKAATT